MPNSSSVSAVLAAALLAVAVPTASFAAKAPKAAAASLAEAKQKVIIQVSDNDPKKWNLALNNAQNVQQDLGKGAVDIELVAYGPGLDMLKLESESGGRVKQALADGIKVVACENTMRKQKLGREDMLPDLAYVKAGVVELAQKQSQGYAYIRP